MTTKNISILEDRAKMMMIVASLAIAGAIGAWYYAIVSVQKVRREYADLQPKVDALKKDTEQLEKDKNTLSVDKKQLENDKKVLQDEQARLKDENVQLETDKNTLSVAKHQLENDNRTLRDEQKRIEMKKKELETKIENLTPELAAMEANLKQAEERLRETASGEATLQKLLDTTKADLNAKTKEAASLKSDLATTESKLKQTEGRLQDVATGGATLQKLLDKTKTDLNAKTEEAARLKKELDENEGIIVVIKNLIEKRDLEVQTLQNERNSAISQKNAIQQRLNNCKDDYRSYIAAAKGTKGTEMPRPYYVQNPSYYKLQGPDDF